MKLFDFNRVLVEPALLSAANEIMKPIDVALPKSTSAKARDKSLKVLLEVLGEQTDMLLDLARRVDPSRDWFIVPQYISGGFVVVDRDRTELFSPYPGSDELVSSLSNRGPDYFEKWRTAPPILVYQWKRKRWEDQNKCQKCGQSLPNKT